MTACAGLTYHDNSCWLESDRPNDTTGPKTLSDLGISKHRSSDFGIALEQSLSHDSRICLTRRVVPEVWLARLFTAAALHQLSRWIAR